MKFQLSQPHSTWYDVCTVWPTGRVTQVKNENPLFLTTGSTFHERNTLNVGSRSRFMFLGDSTMDISWHRIDDPWPLFLPVDDEWDSCVPLQAWGPVCD